MTTVNLGIVYEPHPSELSELSSVLKEITNDEPQKERIIGYAGPNEVVQMLIDVASWPNALWSLALLFGGKFAISFATELGKLAATDVWKEKKNYYEAIKQNTAAPFLKLFNAIKALRTKEQTVTIAIKIPDTPRNAGLVLESNDPAEIAWQISNVIRCAEKIRDIIIKARSINPHLTNGSNPDMSIVIEVLENGDVKVLDEIIKD